MTQQTDFAEWLLTDDERLLAEMLREFGAPVRATIIRKYKGLLDEGDAEDLLSIGLYRFWKSRQQYDPNKSSLRVWFFRIVENAARDVFKHGWHKARRLEVSVEPSALAATAAGFSNNGHDGDAVTKSASGRQIDVREIVAGLPECQRQIIQADALSRDGKASSRQLGDRLGIPASTVRVYRMRAINTIRDAMQRLGHGPP